MKNLLNVADKIGIINLYGLMLALGMLAGVVVAGLVSKKKGYNKDMVLDVALFALPCAIIGARLYYCIFNGVDYFLQIFEIWRGGMAIYGGVIGGFLGVLLCCKVRKYSLLQACDVAVVGLILGQAIGRIGCYFAGCCYGIEVTNSAFQFFPLSVQISGVWHYATFFYESFFDLIGFVVLLVISSKTKKEGVSTASYLMTYGLIRAILEQFRDEAEALTLGTTGIRVSQLLSVVLIITGAVILVLVNKKNRTGESANEQL